MDEDLGLLQYHFWKVPKCQHALEISTNNILTSLTSQLQNLRTLLPNFAPTPTDEPPSASYQTPSTKREHI